MLSSAGAFLFLWFFTTPTVFARIHEQLFATPAGWTYLRTPSDNSNIKLQIALAQQNVPEFESKLLAVSTPGSPSHGQFLEGDTVSALLKPLTESDDAVFAWLANAGISGLNVVSDGEWVNFITTVGTANKLLNTTFKIFQHGVGGTTVLRTTEYSLPEHLSNHIDFISPTTYFGKSASTATIPKKKQPRPIERQIDSICGALITPKCLKELYNVKNYTADPDSGSRIGFPAFSGESAVAHDLSLFEKFLNIPQQQFTTQIINNGSTVEDNHQESNLDVQFIVGMSNPLPVISYVVGGIPPFIPNLDEPTADDNTNEPFLPYYQNLLSQTNKELPNVISNSWSDDEQTVPKSYAKRVCNMIGQLGLRGISVLYSSGDTGVGAACKSNDGKNTTQFTPQFPSSCPWVTSVGGTQSIAPEVAWINGAGGFSNYFEQPDYQKNAIKNYLTNHISNSTLSYYNHFTNVTMRGFPDVSAHSESPDYIIVVDNQTDFAGGTSAACPTFSGIIALLNDARFKAGKSALGFLNPWLYSVGFNGLTDIISGGSVGCNGVDSQTGVPFSFNGLFSGIVPFASWNATKGWDPVTGLGVPNFEKLLKLALEL